MPSTADSRSVGPLAPLRSSSFGFGFGSFLAAGFGFGLGFELFFTTGLCFGFCLKSWSWLRLRHRSHKNGFVPIPAKHAPNLNAIEPAVVELSRVGCLRHPLTRHVPRASVGTGGYRCRSNMNFIEWWHRKKKTARESINPFQRYTFLESVTGWSWVGSDGAANTQISPLNHWTLRTRP